MKYIFLFLKHFVQTLNYSVAYGQFAMKKVQDEFKFISLFLSAIMVLISGIMFFKLIGEFSTPQLDYAFGSLSFIGIVLFVAFIGLILAYFFPESNSIDKDIPYYNKILNESPDIVDDISNEDELLSSFESRFVQNNFDEIFTELKKNKFLNDEGKKLFKHKRHYSVLLVKLIELNFIENLVHGDLKTLHLVASNFFQDKFDYAQMTTIINEFKDGVPTHGDKKFYKSLSFLNDI